MKGNIYNSGRVTQTYSYAFQTNSFINNIIIEMKKEDKHDKVVEKVVKRLIENNLHVKLKKCK